MQKIIDKLFVKIANWCESRGKRYIITGGPKDDTPYLVRYILFKSRFGCIYIHRFLRSDKDYPHDHPWNFFTYVISGGYIEMFYDRGSPKKDMHNTKYLSFWSVTENKRLPGSIAYRKATDIHKVVVDKSRTMEELSDAPFTICLMGPRLRHWGFWELSKKGSVWIDWRKYLNMSPNDSRIEGSE